MSLAGAEGFEPPNARTKTWCLTTWPRPNILIDYNLFSECAWGFVRHSDARTQLIIFVIVCTITGWCLTTPPRPNILSDSYLVVMYARV
jgi:hypothetical protein